MTSCANTSELARTRKFQRVAGLMLLHGFRHGRSEHNGNLGIEKDTVNGEKPAQFTAERASCSCRQATTLSRPGDCSPLPGLPSHACGSADARGAGSNEEATPKPVPSFPIRVRQWTRLLAWYAVSRDRHKHLENEYRTMSDETTNLDLEQLTEQVAEQIMFLIRQSVLLVALLQLLAAHRVFKCPLLRQDLEQAQEQAFEDAMRGEQLEERNQQN